MISVIIPAHNEERVIERCLNSLLVDAPAELEILVVCNGCRDATAELARRVPGPIRVLETATAGKRHALNLGDQEARGFPRFYVDADVTISGAALRATAAVLSGGPILAAAPRMTVDLEHASWFVRAFYDVWLSLPYCRAGMIGSGVYALAQAGRERFGEFPDIISDDGFVRAHFGPDERQTVESCRFGITAPRTLWGVIQIKTRSQFGKYQLYRRFPELKRNDPRSYTSSSRELLRDPRRWPAVLVYCFVLAVARVRAAGRFLARRERVWDRDETSRIAARAAGAAAGPPAAERLAGERVAGDTVE